MTFQRLVNIIIHAGEQLGFLRLKLRDVLLHQSHAGTRFAGFTGLPVVSSTTMSMSASLGS